MSISVETTFMQRAVTEAARARLIAPPNPWVGAVVVGVDGVVQGVGHTSAPGGPHAEIVALEAAGENARGATLYVTLEPCSHVGRTPPCVESIVRAGLERVVVGIEDPDPRVSGRGITELRRAGIHVESGVSHETVSEQLAPYLWHRRTGRPFVVAKIASTLDGVIAMVDGSSKWITGAEAREDAHLLRAQSQAIVVGAGTVRSDDPVLTARLSEGTFEPLRVVLGRVSPSARVRPCLEFEGSLELLLDDLAARGVLQVLVEGGARVFGEFLSQRLVNRIVWYVAPAWAGGLETHAALAELSTPTMDELRRGTLCDVRRVGGDIRIEVEV